MMSPLPSLFYKQGGNMVDTKGVYELTVDNLYMDDGKTYKAGMYTNPNSVMLEYIKGNHIHDGKPVFIFHPEIVDEFDPDGDKDKVSGDGTEDSLALPDGGDLAAPEPGSEVSGSEVIDPEVVGDGNPSSDKRGLKG